MWCFRLGCALKNGGYFIFTVYNKASVNNADCSEERANVPSPGARNWPTDWKWHEVMNETQQNLQHEPERVSVPFTRTNICKTYCKHNNTLRHLLCSSWFHCAANPTIRQIFVIPTSLVLLLESAKKICLTFRHRASSI